MKHFNIIICLLLSVVFYSCSKEEETGVEYFPFQESEKGLWGMMSPTGEILFSEEFKEKPTVARDGRFMVRNQDGLWEIYTAEAKPQKIGSEYASASMFQNGKAIVAEKNKAISIIDTDCKTVKTLDKADGRAVDAVDRFSEGYGVYKTENGYGVLNADGKSVIKPDYCFIAACADGKFIAVNKKYEKELRNDSTENLKYDVLDTKGESILTLSKSKYKEIGLSFHNGMLDVYIESKDEKCGGIINEKGEYVVKPTAKIKKIGEIRNKFFTYNNGDGWGLMNLEGETLVRAKYDGLFFADDDMLVAITKKENGSTFYKFIDSEDNQIGDDTFDFAYSFEALDGNHAFVKVSDKLYSIVDKKGVQVEKLPDMVDVRLSEADYTVESDYVDLGVLLDKVNFTQNGVDSLNFKTTPAEFVKFYAKQNDCYYGDKEHKATDPYWYDLHDNYSYSKNISNIYAVITTQFSGKLSQRTYKTKRVIDYTFGDYYWYHNERTPTGYAFNKVNVNNFLLTFSNNGKLRGKLLSLYRALAERFKNMGTVEKENNRAMIVKLKNGQRAIIAMKEENVFAMWGNVKADIDISEYKDVKEKPIRLKDFDFFENNISIAGSQEEGIDSTAVVAD